MHSKPWWRGRLSVGTVVTVLLVTVLVPLASVWGGERFPDETWQRYAKSKEAGFSSRKLKKAKKYWKSIPSAAVMVVCDGAVVVAWGDVERRFMLHSARKSLMSALYGLHVDAGRIDVEKTLEQFGIGDEHPSLSPEERQAKLIHLLAARSGVYHAAAAEPPQNPKPPRGSHPPGTHWCYNNWDFNVVGTIFRQELGVDIFEEFKSRFADPLGMQDFRVRHGHYQLEPRKSIHPAYPMRLSARDMARFGLLFLNKGKWNDTQILSEKWVAESTRAHSHSPSGDGYGYMWWLPKQKPFKSLGMFSALGVGEQSIDVIPGANVVIVHRCNTYAGENVSRKQRLKLLKMILDAKVSEPKRDPKLKPLKPAKSSYKAIELSLERKQALCGRVPLDPFKDTVTVRLDGEELVFEGSLGIFGLIPVAQDRFILEDVNWVCHAELDADGSLSRLVLQR